MLADIALLGCLASTLFMCGLIWFVQVVHYPLFERVERGSFATYHAAHTRLTTFVVFGPMLVELLTSIALAAPPPRFVGPIPCWIGLAMAGIAWASTGLVQVPCHTRLGASYSDMELRRLVRTNWVRVASWTIHAVIVLGMTAARILA